MAQLESMIRRTRQSLSTVTLSGRGTPEADTGAEYSSTDLFQDVDECTESGWHMTMPGIVEEQALD